MFRPFVELPEVRLIGVEAGGRGQSAGDHASTLSFGRPGVLHGSFSYVLQDDDGQTSPVHSVSAGLDYPGVGPEHSYWKDTGRVKYVAVGDDAALSAFRKCSELEGIIPAVETAHAIQYVLETAGDRPASDNLVICLSGRGDKDVYEVARLLGEEL
jgi:tryptophan synthase beta chain